jgi:hypothetical protein
MQWDGEGSIYKISSNQILFQGVMEGIMYVESEEGELDGAFAKCPVSQKINPETMESFASGYCEISVAPDDVIYSEFECMGKAGDCKGKFRLVEGIGRFAGITGGSDLRIRSVLGALVIGMGSGSVVRSGKGIALLPNLKVINPSNN